MNKTLPENTRSGSEGMTIIELMIVLVIASVFAIAMYKVFETSAKMASRQNVAIDAQEGLRGALNFMAKDLSMAGLSSSAAVGYPGIVLADTTSVRFQADRDLSGMIETGNAYGGANVPEILEFRLEDPGAAETRLVVIPNPSADGSVAADPAGQIVLLENVTGMDLSFVDPNGNRLTLPLTSPANLTELRRIRAVEISLTARLAHTAQTTGSELTMVKYIRCRNLGIWE